ncbi:MAG: COQ9 family protein [Sphingobium sp.]|nr:COQ9 family protein [Sphingobium sp.]
MTLIAPTDTGMRPDETLDELRARLAPLVAANAGFDGWSPKAVAMAAEQAGIDKDIAGLAFKDGAMAMIAAWFGAIDAVMLERLPAGTLAVMKIRERITALVEARLTLLAPHREALRRAQAILAMPNHVTQAARLGWHAADVMWRAAGDTAVDYNHYTKRATLGAVYAATLLTFVNDESADFAETRAFLARRIEDIMRFEKAKARVTAQSDMHFSPARFLGRLRYRASQR